MPVLIYLIQTHESARLAAGRSLHLRAAYRTLRGTAHTARCWSHQTHLVVLQHIITIRDVTHTQTIDAVTSRTLSFLTPFDVGWFKSFSSIAVWTDPWIVCNNNDVVSDVINTGVSWWRHADSPTSRRFCLRALRSGTRSLSFCSERRRCAARWGCRLRTPERDKIMHYVFVCWLVRSTFAHLQAVDVHLELKFVLSS